MERVPPASERKALLDALGELIASRGVGRFVASPIVEPDETFFPDPWEPNARGVATLARRLLAYAGLPELRVDVVMYTNETRITQGGMGGVGVTRETSHEGAAAWFAGIRDGVCHFGADTNQLEQPRAIVGTMAHEIAHAYREHHNLCIDERDREERLTDLTTIYLGFGVLTVNASYLYRSSGGMEGQMTYTRWSHARAGYLSPQAMSFLLAAQVVARAAPGEHKWIARHLETNQAAYFKAARKLLDVGDVLTALQLPPREAWPPPFEHARPEPLTVDGHIVDGVAEAAPAGGDDVDIVFRVKKTAARRWAGAGAFLGLVAGTAIHLASNMGIAMMLAGAAAGFLLGLYAGALRPRDCCSEPACATPLPPGVTVCPGCRGKILAAIAHADQRLELREKHEATQRRRRRLRGRS